MVGLVDQTAAPDARVVLLEADRCGFGPSGRNGGFVNSMWFSLPTMRAMFGDERALAMVHAGDASVTAIAEWCEEQEVDAWFTHGGYMQASTAPHFDDTWEPVAAACEQLGEGGRVEVLDRAATQRRCASPLFRGAAFYRVGATVQPARLAAGLRERLLGTGVEIHEDTPVRSLTEQGRRRDRDRPTAERSAASAAILGAGRVAAAVPAAAPLADRDLQPHGDHRAGARPDRGARLDRRRVHHRLAGDGPLLPDDPRRADRLRLGRRRDRPRRERPRPGRDRSRRSPPRSRRTCAGSSRSSRAARSTHAWGGPIDVSPTHLPVIRTVGERTFAGFGYTGNGVGPSQMVGHALASMALDRRDEFTSLAIVDPPPVQRSPEPFRFAGGTIIRRAILRKEAAEEEDRVPGPITRMVSGIPERIGIHVGR